MKAELAIAEIPLRLIGKQRMVPLIHRLPDQTTEIAGPIKHRIDAQRIGRGKFTVQ